MPAYEERVIRPSKPEEKEPEPLEEDQREALVALIQKEQPLRLAVEDAARGWKEEDLKAALSPKFYEIWKEECLGEGDSELRFKAEEVAGSKRVEEVLNPEAEGFGDL